METKYSKSFKKQYKNGALVKKTLILTIPPDILLDILKKWRRGIEDLIPNEPIKLNDKPSTWGIFTPYLIYNILIFKQNFDHDNYLAPEDDSTVDSIYTRSFSVEKTQDDPNIFYMDGIIGRKNFMHSVSYQLPSDKVLVAYLRTKRKHFDLTKNREKFVVYHNILARIIFDVEIVAS